MRVCRFGFGIVAFCLSIGVAAAGNFSFSGTFSQDDQLEVLQFTAPSAITLLRTWGYAGGTNTNGQLVSPGGFDPILSVFDATGGLLPSSLLIDSNNDGAGVATDGTTGNAFDSLLLLSALNPGGTYVLILSQNDNFANGTTYGDGFGRSGQGNFTADAFGCGGTAPFCESLFVPQRDGHWAVDISGVESAADITDNGGAGVPEPGTILLLVTGLTSLALLGRRRKSVLNQCHDRTTRC
jgi:hypothetical protein